MHLQNDYDKVKKMFESDPSDLNKIRLNEVKEKLELFYGGKSQRDHHSRKSSLVRTW